MEDRKKSIDEIPNLALLEQKRNDIAFCIKSAKIEHLEKYNAQLDYIDQVISSTKQIAMVFKDRPPGDDEHKDPHLFV